MSEHRYHLDGKRVPGVTAVIGELGWKTGALLHWAYKLGRKDADIEGATLELSQGEALSDGKRVHSWIEYTLTGKYCFEDLDVFDQISAAGVAYRGWCKSWLPKKELLMLSIEKPITSREFRCGGRPDYVAIDGKEGHERVCVFDWKTYNGDDGRKEPYPEYWVQLAAYAEMYRVDTGRIIDDLVVVMLNKTTGEADEYRLPVLSDKADAALRAFKLARELYDLRKTLTKKEEGWE